LKEYELYSKDEKIGVANSQGDNFARPTEFGGRKVGFEVNSLV
jgi:hypothetical protein